MILLTCFNIDCLDNSSPPTNWNQSRDVSLKHLYIPSTYQSIHMSQIAVCVWVCLDVCQQHSYTYKSGHINCSYITKLFCDLPSGKCCLIPKYLIIIEVWFAPTNKIASIKCQNCLYPLFYRQSLLTTGHATPNVYKNLSDSNFRCSTTCLSLFH